METVAPPTHMDPGCSSCLYKSRQDSLESPYGARGRKPPVAHHPVPLAALVRHRGPAVSGRCHDDRLQAHDKQRARACESSFLSTLESIKLRQRSGTRERGQSLNDTQTKHSQRTRNLQAGESVLFVSEPNVVINVNKLLQH